MKPRNLIILGAAIGIVIGAVLPWVTAGPFSVNGTSGDGKLTLLAGIIIAICAVAGGALWAAGIGGFIVFLVAAYDLQQLSAIAPGPFGLRAEAGSGLILTLLAGIVLLGVVAAEAIKRRRMVA